MESVIASLPLQLVGCSEAERDEDVFFETLATQGQSVQPVLLTKEGRPFVEFIDANGKSIQRFLDQPTLQGDILVRQEDGEVCIAQQVALHRWRLNIVPPNEKA